MTNMLRPELDYVAEDCGDVVPHEAHITAWYPPYVCAGVPDDK